MDAGNEQRAGGTAVANADSFSFATLQCISSTSGMLIGQALGSSFNGRLVASVVLSLTGSFLTAPGKHHRRRIVAVVVLVALLNAARALARGRKPVPPSTGPSAWAPASWLAVGVTAAAGLMIGGGITAAHGALTDDPGRSAVDPPHRTALTIPEVQGKEKAAAVRTLVDAGFRVSTDREPSRSVPEGIAMRTEPDAGAEARKGSTVTLFVSSGPPTVAIPSVASQTLEAAKAALRDAGLRALVGETEPSDSIAKGDVVRTDPTEGSEVPVGSAVELVLSRGPIVEQLTVPDVAGKSEEEAVAILTEAGLSPTTSSEFSKAIPEGAVIDTDPAAGEQVTEGSPITVIVSSGSGEDRDCDEFSSQEEAQEYFESRGGPSIDPDMLDGDGDGFACE